MMHDRIAKLSKGSFENLKSKTFEVHDGASIHKLELIQVEDRGPGQEGCRDRCCLYFHAKDNAHIEQGTYRLEHAEMEAINLFMTRIMPEKPDDPPSYQIVLG